MRCPEQEQQTYALILVKSAIEVPGLWDLFNLLTIFEEMRKRFREFLSFECLLATREPCGFLLALDERRETIERRLWFAKSGKEVRN